MELNRPPQRKQDDVSTMRGSTLGQMHQGELQTHLSHPFLTAFIKFALAINIGSFIILWALFALKNLFPPHEASFKWAIGSFFIFGAIYTIFSGFFFKFAKFVEAQAVTKSLTHNRRYEWHTKYDTQNISEKDLKKVPEAQRQTTASQAVGAGANYFRITAFLALAALATWGMGVWAFFGGFLGEGE